MSNFSVHMQCYKNELAVEKCIESFRKWYPNEQFRLVSDNGSDFSELAKRYNLVFDYKSHNILPKGKFANKEDVYIYLERIYETCLLFDSEWIILFEDDVLTKGHIIEYPSTSVAGISNHSYSYPLLQHLNDNNAGYGMCGGSIFKRKVFIECYERKNFDIKLLSKLDERVAIWTDLPLTLLFQINEYEYSIWRGVDEPTSGIYKIGSAFQHNYKEFYERI